MRQQETVTIRRVEDGAAAGDAMPDAVAVEEPLEIEVEYGPTDADGERARATVAVTMRTPGHDEELAAGFLWTEGVLPAAPDAIERVRPVGLPSSEGYRNAVRVTLREDVPLDLERLTRHVFTSSSCGVCGKASRDAVRAASPFDLAESRAAWTPGTIHALPDRLRTAQTTFDRTGGLHAAGLFDADGEPLVVREDVGRHNAVDKVIGAMLRAGRLPLRDTLLLVSGRASFELVQKAALAGVPVLAAVGAPSSLAVSLAEESHMTLLGFVRGARFNVYAGVGRVAL